MSSTSTPRRVSTFISRAMALCQSRRREDLKQAGSAFVSVNTRGARAAYVFLGPFWQAGRGAAAVSRRRPVKAASSQERRPTTRV